jgi:activator of HSP90 ATPase
MAETIKFSVDLPVSPERVYRAWLDSYEHSRFTGQPAQISSRVGESYSSLGGKVTGKMMVATPFSHIVQTWRTDDFPPGSPASQVDLKLEPTCLGAQLTLTQSGIPDGLSRQVLSDWEKQYFRPLNAYFEDLVGDSMADMDG